MAQSLAKVFVHIIFSTKGRAPFLADPGLRREMHAYLAALLKAQDAPAQVVGGTADHVHVLCALPRDTPISKIVGELKRGSSRWAKSKGGGLEGLYWQNGYGVFSVSHSNLTRVRDYIRDQVRHHETRSFQDEFLRFLRRHGVDYDKRYVWD
jgi:putative transposase